jgi:hypothetical protein
METMQTRRIRASRTAYSTEVGPSSLPTKRRRADRHVFMDRIPRKRHGDHGYDGRFRRGIPNLAQI